METILITGGTGFLGTHVTKVFKERYQKPDWKVVSVGSSVANLETRFDTVDLIDEYQPSYVVHLAGYSGGIYSNRLKPADYFSRNILMLTYMFEACAKFGHIKRLLVPMGGCSYPANATSPIREESMWQGYPQVQSAGYSMAKKMALVMSASYWTQYGLNSTVIVPGNMYGPHDNFSLTDSHVVPAMIRKIFEAKRKGAEEVTFWGTGNPVRDFVYVEDVAQLIPFFLFDYKGSSPINISTGAGIPMRDLVDIIAKAMQYTGKILWDITQPDGQMMKIFDTKKFESLYDGRDKNWFMATLGNGLLQTIQWFEENYDKEGEVRL